MPSSTTARVAAFDGFIAVLKTPALASELASQPDLWAEIKRLAMVHRFSGLLAHGASAWLPASERSWRDQILVAHYHRHAQRLEALRRLVEAFRNKGLPCVSLKGPLLAERFYAIPFLRPASDLDLLIRECDVGPSARLMHKMGFRLEGYYPWSLQRRLSHHLNYGATASSPRVEVHYDLRAGRFSFDSAALLDRSVVWQSAGFESRVLSIADEAFFSTVHAANHAFHRLGWLYDAINIARRLSAEDRIRVRQLAIRHGQTGHFVAARMAAQAFFGESLDLDCADFSTPWLWRSLAPRHTRRMVERVDGTTSTLLEKVGSRIDLCRMAGSPLDAARLLAWQLDIEARKRCYSFINRADPNTLARTLPD
jgi:hypothetical protein